MNVPSGDEKSILGTSSGTAHAFSFFKESGKFTQKNHFKNRGEFTVKVMVRSW
jgi:hypothetical protein